MKYLAFLILLIAVSCQNKPDNKPAEVAISSPAYYDTENTTPENEAHALVLKVMKRTGDYADLVALGDVQYEYIYKKSPTEIDVSEERYSFESEQSWAQYDVHTASLMTDRPGRIVQGYDGRKSWMTLDGERIEDPKLLKRADFNRKTNFYWFCMMQKLNDPGLSYESLPDAKQGDIDYKLVKVTFNDGVGDAQDDYTLYINPFTMLVDQFLFTVRDFNREAPLLMELKYTKHRGLRLPTYRRYAPIDSSGKITGDWIEEISDKIKFGNNFPIDMYKAPVTG